MFKTESGDGIDIAQTRWASGSAKSGLYSFCMSGGVSAFGNFADIQFTSPDVRY